MGSSFRLDSWKSSRRFCRSSASETSDRRVLAGRQAISLVFQLTSAVLGSCFWADYLSDRKILQQINCWGPLWIFIKYTRTNIAWRYISHHMSTHPSATRLLGFTMQEMNVGMDRYSEAREMVQPNAEATFVQNYVLEPFQGKYDVNNM